MKFLFCYDWGMKRKIILIGGMPTVGKTTIARQLSHRLNLPYISTDQIRLIMQSVADPNKHPLLFNAAGYSAEEFLEKYSPLEIASMEYAQSNEVWPGVKHFIDNDWVWRDGFIIEGVNILPSFVSEIIKESRDVQSVFLSDTHHDRIASVIYNRGLFGDAKTYSDHVKAKEVEWVKIYDAMIRHDAKVFNLPLVEISKDTSDIERLMRVVS